MEQVETRSHRGAILLQRVYRYRKHVRWIPCFIAAVMFAFGLLPAFSAAALWLESGTSIPPSLRLTLPLGLGTFALALLGSGILVCYFSFRLAGVRIIVDDEDLVYENRSRIHYIPYEDIVRVETPSIRYTGGWLKIITQKGTFRLTVVIEGIAELVQRLKNKLDERALQSCYDQEKLFSFLKTATFSDNSWDRIYEGFWRFLLLMLLWTLTGFTIVEVAGGVLSAGIFASLVSCIYSLLPYYVAEFLFAQKIRRDADPNNFTCPARDKGWEKRTFRKALLLSVLLYASICAALFIAFRTFG